MNKILCSSFVMLLTLAFINGAPNRLIEIACQRNPSLPMCYRGSNMRDDPFPRSPFNANRHVAPPSRRFFGRFLNDQPIANDKDSLLGGIPKFDPSVKVSVFDLPKDVIETCTPDCTALHCTSECKCAHTHHVVHSRCNPPANAHMADHCQAWYSKCPMFHPIQY